MSVDQLKELATAYGIETFYYEDNGRFCEATPESLIAVLKVLGAPVETPEDAPAALRAFWEAHWQRPLEPVTVAWDGRGEAALRLPASQAGGEIRYRLEYEGGGGTGGTVRGGELPARDRSNVHGTDHVSLALALPEAMPTGYHRLVVELPGGAAEGLVMSAPTRAFVPTGEHAKTCGLFLPTYAIRSQRDWGAGDFTDLANLIAWVQQHGGGLAGTLPLLAAYLGETVSGDPDYTPYEPSPYSPASRLFWNEFYLDVDRAYRDAGREPPADADLVRERDELRRLDLVDYRRAMTLKRRYLFELMRQVFGSAWTGRAAFEKFVGDHPRVRDYAAFRATVEKRHESWWAWPERLRGGVLQEGDYDADVARYHEFVQFLIDGQLRALAEQARRSGPGLYLDLPLGVNSDSYDVWRERSVFAVGASGGAPPDTFFTKGQDWGFPPMHPEQLRQQGYQYLRDCLHQHMRFAGMLRIDHVMGLHRLFWVPWKLGARNGAYVKYRVDEMYAVFTIESTRHHTLLVGEDLGTVPEAVRPAMGKHEIHRLYVGQYEMRPNPERPIGDPPAGAIASLNTHDMPPFAAWWQCLDVADRHQLGLLDDAAMQAELDQRAEMRRILIEFLRREGFLGESAEFLDVLLAFNSYLASGPVSALLLNAEDLWQGTEPQNVPGTWRERPNWRRKAAHPIESFAELPGLRETLAAVIAQVRKGG